MAEDHEFIGRNPDTGKKYWKRKEKKKKKSSKEEGEEQQEEDVERVKEGPNKGFPTPEQMEKSRENYFPNIEDSLPSGDKDED